MASAFKIEKGVPIPGPTRTKYPFDDLVIGDSFFVPCGGDDGKRESNIRSLATARRRKGQSSYRVKRVEGGVRVWRIA